MKIIKSIPKNDGFYMPAEFSPHYGCIMIWPERGDSWQYGGYEARKAFIKAAEIIAKSEKLTVLASEAQYNNARAVLAENIRVVELSTDDSWARDTAPTFVTNGKTIRGIDWNFNAWGGLVDGLYFPWERDRQLARKLCDLYDVDVYDERDFILEGGSIHSNGAGTILTTEECLLSEGRNSHMTKAEIEQKLKDTLGAKKIIWLPYGIYNDETNGHIDNICAFISETDVVLAWTDDENDPQYKLSSACLKALENSTTADGRKITVHKLPLPKPVLITEHECEGLDTMDGLPTRTANERLAASYVNFYISNGAIVMPFFNDKNDEIARNILASLFPTREVIGVYARDILIGGGNFHCLTQQIPLGIPFIK